MAKSKWRCKNPDCETANAEEHARGLCQPCYISTLRKVNKHEPKARPRVWAQIVSAGLALPAKKPGRRPSPMSVALKKAGL